MLPFNIPLSAFELARERIRPYIRHTPLAPLPALEDDLPHGLRLKLENIQVSGSFKARGVFNHLLQLGDEQRVRGVIAASGGNHGLALAYGAARLGIRAVIYLTAGATADRVARITHWGAEVVQHGAVWDEAQAEAVRRAERDGLYMLHPFDEDKTLEGQGTLGLELLEDAPETDCVLLAIGGGGLIAGAAAALRQIKPSLRVIGVEPVGAASMQSALKAGHVVELGGVNTIADTLSPRAVTERTRVLTERYVDHIVTVTDGEMIAAMRWLWRATNQLVEPSGAAVMAAIFNGALPTDVQHPVAVICGGNASAECVFNEYEAAARQRGSME